MNRHNRPTDPPPRPIPGRTDNTAWRRARRRAVQQANGLCQQCHKPLNPAAPRATPDATEIDHIVPLSKGGAPYDPANLRALHRRCHQLRQKVGTASAPLDTWVDGVYYCADPECRVGPHSRKW